MRHRRAAAKIVLVAGAACAGLGAAPSAQADAPVRTGWWNAASAGGVAAPSTTTTGDLHLANGAAGPLATAAVSYHGEPYTSATLTLHVVTNSAAGTPAVLACPTKDDTWKAGGDQPLSDAPAYTCQGRAVTGVTGTDTAGETLTFLLDASAQLTPGTTTLALVPATGSTTPFSLDLAKPGATALVVDTVPAPPAGTGPSSQPTTTSGPPAAPSGASPSGPAPAGLSTGSGLSGAVPLSQPPAGVAPALAPPLPTAAGPSAPEVAGSLAGSPTGAPLTLPPANRAAATNSDRGRNTALVLLVALVGGLGYLLGDKQTPALRLLGGRARAAGVVPEDGPAPLGGIGRFAKPRTSPARRLL